MTIDTDRHATCVEIGKALAQIELARDALCTHTGDQDIDGGLKDAVSDLIPEAIDELALFGDDADEAREIIEETQANHVARTQRERAMLSARRTMSGQVVR